jgi:hypothetical protein
MKQPYHAFHSGPELPLWLPGAMALIAIVGIVL